jgi:hypothetical protein
MMPMDLLSGRAWPISEVARSESCQLSRDLEQHSALFAGHGISALARVQIHTSFHADGLHDCGTYVMTNLGLVAEKFRSWFKNGTDIWRRRVRDSRSNFLHDKHNSIRFELFGVVFTTFLPAS